MDSSLGIISWIIFGALAGWVASLIAGTNQQQGWLENIIVGIIGAYIGGFLANAAGIQLGEFFQGWFWGNVLVSVVGAVILIVVVKMLRGR